jgi:hypothetical protein
MGAKSKQVMAMRQKFCAKFSPTMPRELKNAVTGWLHSQAAYFYEEGTSKTVHRYD